MPAVGRLRASDSDRDRAIAALREHHAEGRLDFAEFTRRMEAAQRATYVDELAEQFTDLPRHRVPEPALRRGRGPSAALRLVPVALVAVLAAGVVLAVVAHLLPLWLPLVVLWVVACHGRSRSKDRSRTGSRHGPRQLRMDHCGRSKPGEPFPIAFRPPRTW